MSINSLTPAQEAYFNAINYRGAGNEAEILNYVLGLNDAQAKASYDAVTRSGPSLGQLVTAAGGTLDSADPSYADTMRRATDARYGNVGANIDARDWDSILSSGNVLQEANDALAAMYSDPAYREKNTASLVSKGYTPAQAYFTYGQMNDRVGAKYVPTSSEISAVENYFKSLGQPNFKWNVSAGGQAAGGTSGANTNNVMAGGTGTTGNAGTQLDSGVTPRVMGPLPSGAGAGAGGNSGGNSGLVVGAADGQMLGAGNADYHSSLIKSLRQNSMTPFSSNQGVQILPGQGATTSNWKPPVTTGNSAFNPTPFSPRVASEQEISDWNAYSDFRQNALRSQQPLMSFAEWLAGGKSDGKQQAAGPGVDSNQFMDA